jgi:Ca-activated chloride channel family protein
MKRKTISALVLALTLSGLLASTALADGMMIPFPSEVGYLQVDYHRVTVTIDGPHAHTSVEQRFSNPYLAPIEARYVFPLPPGATIRDFTVQLDGASQTVQNMSRAETESYLQKAIADRQDPSLLQYLGWETYAVDLTLPSLGGTTMVLEYEELLLPQGDLYHYFYTLGTERYSLAPLGEVSVKVDVRADDGIATVYSPGHQLAVERVSAGHVRAAYHAENVLPTEHFDLYYTLTGQPFGAGLLTHADAERPGEGHFLLLLSPSSSVAEADAAPKDIVFVVDRSGSMAGEKIEQARQALQFILGQLGEEDRFAIISFDDRIETQAEALQPVTAQTIRRAQSYVAGLYERGNTDIEGALRRGLEMLPRLRGGGQPRSEATAASSHVRSGVIVFLTDGLPTAGVTDEAAIVDSVRLGNKAVGASIHVFGVGYDVNTHLLDRIAAQNHGAVTYVQPGESLERVLTTFYSQIAHPLLTDVEVEFEGLTVEDVYPRQLPDLFVGSSLALVGRYSTTDSAEAVVWLRGHKAGEAWEQVYNFDLTEVDDHPFVARLWATRRVGELLDRVRVERETAALVEETKALGLRYGIVTPYTVGVVQGQASGAASAANMQLYQQDLDGDGRPDINQVSGAATVGARAQNLAYQQATQVGLAAGANVVNVGDKSAAQVGRYAFDLSLVADLGLDSLPVADEGWLEENVDRTVRFASEEYFELAKDAAVNQLLQAGPNVVFEHEGEVIAVQADPPPTQQAPAPQDVGHQEPEKLGGFDSLLLDVTQWLGRFLDLARLVME